MFKNFLRRLTAGLSIFTASTSSAYDNSQYPAFEMATVGRGFENISIHPNDNEWLISECSDAFTPYSNCYLMIYNLRNRSYKRLGLSKNYAYVEGRFSPTGEQIIFVRQPPSKKGGHADVMNSYSNGEIVVMNRDGSNFRVLPIPPNRIISPTLSPSGTKLAYLVAGSNNPRGHETFLAFFEIWEFDLNSGEHQLFAGPMKFYHATTISYLSESEIIAGAFAPAYTSEPKARDYFEPYQGSEIFKIKRGVQSAPEPNYYDFPFAKFPTVDRYGNIFYETAPQKIGFALTRKDILGKITLWREPRMNLGSVSQYAAAPSGDYVAFIYESPSIKPTSGKHALGFFDLRNEKWNSVIPPPMNESILVPLKTTH